MEGSSLIYQKVTTEGHDIYITVDEHGRCVVSVRNLWDLIVFPPGQYGVIKVGSIGPSPQPIMLTVERHVK
jgi:hypothetical protein